jgi:hypothetical protein
MQGGESGPRERSEEGHMCGVIFFYFTGFGEGQSTYMRVVDGKIVYRVYAIFSGENNVCSWVSSKVNCESDFYG